MSIQRLCKAIINDTLPPWEDYMNDIEIVITEKPEKYLNMMLDILIAFNKNKQQDIRYYDLCRKIAITNKDYIQNIIRQMCDDEKSIYCVRHILDTYLPPDLLSEYVPVKTTDCTYEPANLGEYIIMLKVYVPIYPEECIPYMHHSLQANYDDNNSLHANYNSDYQIPEDMKKYYEKVNHYIR